MIKSRNPVMQRWVVKTDEHVAGVYHVDAPTAEDARHMVRPSLFRPRAEPVCEQVGYAAYNVMVLNVRPIDEAAA